MKTQKQLVASFLMYEASDRVGAQAYMMEDCCEDYDNVRMISIDQSTYGIDQQHAILNDFAKQHKITKEEIMKYLNNVPNYDKGFVDA